MKRVSVSSFSIYPSICLFICPYIYIYLFKYETSISIHFQYSFKNHFALVRKVGKNKFKYSSNQKRGIFVYDIKSKLQASNVYPTLQTRQRRSWNVCDITSIMLWPRSSDSFEFTLKYKKSKVIWFHIRSNSCSIIGDLIENFLTCNLL